MAFNLGGFAQSWADNVAETEQQIEDFKSSVNEANKPTQKEKQEPQKSGTNSMEAYGAKIGRWLSNPMNAVFAAVILFGIFWGARQ